MAKNIGADDHDDDRADDSPRMKRTMNVSIHGIIPRLREVALTEHAEPVEYEEFIFTLPRVHFMLMCSHSSGLDQTYGVQLAGVHGAGKSTMLRALVGMLCVGADVDSWYEADASQIYDSGRVAPIMCSSSGPVMDHINPQARSGSEHAVEAWTRSVPGSDCPWRVPYCHVFDPGKRYARGGKKLIVFDEVNKALSSRDEKHMQFLQHNRGLPRHFLKIFAASPDGLREKVHAERHVIFFELRPPRVHHMAAIVAVAPRALEQLVPHGTQLPDAAVLPVCLEFASNMRQISRVLQRTFATLQAHDAQSPCLTDAVQRELEHTAAECTKEYITMLAERMTKPVNMTSNYLLEDPETKLFGSIPATNPLGLQLTRMSNASMIVRRDAANRSSPVDFVGDIARELRARAVSQLLRKRHALGDDAGPQNTRMALEHLLEPDTTDGYRFESMIACRLFLRLVSEHVMLLSNLESCIKRHKVAADDMKPPSRTFGILTKETILADIVWTIEPLAESSLPAVCFVRCREPSKIDGKVIAAIQACKSGAVGSMTVIQTAHSAPLCDFVVIMKTERGYKVVFVEATISTLYQHASGKGGSKQGQGVVDIPDEGFGAAAAMEAEMAPRGSRERLRTAAAPSAPPPVWSLDCPPAMREIAALVNRPMYTVHAQGPGFKLTAADSVSTEKAKSVSNVCQVA